MSMRNVRFGAGLIGVMALGGSAHGATISLNFVGGGGLQPNANAALVASDVAGAVPASNYNNVTGASGTNLPLFDADRAATTAALTFAAATTSTTSMTPAAEANERLNLGTVAATSLSITGTVSNVPQSHRSTGYTVYLYLPSDQPGRLTTTTLTPSVGAPITFVSTSMSSAQIDGNASTPYVYTFATAAQGPANAARFTNLTAPSFSFEISAPGLSHLSGIQIVPEPAAAGLLGVGAVGLLARRRRRAV